ncbi:hypothetical protein [Streptomyces afghaniensis]|uniref:hypothetical protein n=1 Tax=Streptomyces afghaniensis TaxID=66865 RepID=UPI0027D7B4CF|nr:hypothetical protein [Streptomyces afghaniensis]
MDEAGDRRIRRVEAAGGAVTALLAVAACAGHATKAELPWWAVLAVAASTAGLAGWTGARMGGQRGPRDEPVPPGEQPPCHPAPGTGHPDHTTAPARLTPLPACGRVDLRDHAVHPARGASGRGAAW